jgi:hypothetical protein
MSLLSLLSLLLAPTGCGTSAPGAKPALGSASSKSRIDELNLVTMPVAVNLDSGFGINGIPVKVYALDYERPKAQPIRDGTLQILMFDSLVRDGFDQTNRCRHVWSYPARDLATYTFTTTLGTGYSFALAWGKDQPRTDKMTLVARYLPPAGRTIYSAPSYVSMPPPASPAAPGAPPPQPKPEENPAPGAQPKP